MENEYILEMKNVRKVFPGVVALDDVSVFLKRGEVHALLGENGAGKSTIMKILAGIYEPDGGEMLYNGEPYHPKRPVDALKKGISMVHQELDLIPEMTVEMNIFAGSEIVKGPLVNKREMVKRTREIMELLEIPIKPEQKIKELSVAQMQMVAIAKAIAFQAEVIIMDEPTSAITNKEVEQLFSLIRKLKAQNKAIVYISHKMEEIYEISDRITILRDGTLVGTMATKGADEKEIIHMLVGRDLSDMYVKTAERTNAFNADEVILEVENLCRRGEFENISFQLKRGEILGVYGLMGAGRTEVVETVFGLRKAERGSVRIKGQEIRGIRQAIHNGMALITEDRKEKGLNLMGSVRENITLVYIGLVQRCASFGEYSTRYLRQHRVAEASRRNRYAVASAPSADANIRHSIYQNLRNAVLVTKLRFLMDLKKEKKVADAYIEKLRIKTSDRETKVNTLSGGNQQKIVIAKWLAGNPELLIMDEPTRGIDIGAKSEIYQLMDEFVKAGKSIIMVSSETPELLGVSDRVLVMHEGKLMGEFDVSEVSQEKLMHLAIG